MSEEVVELDDNEVSIPKTRKLWSAVWKDFDKEKNNGKDFAKCKHCKRLLSAKSSSGTTHLKNHLMTCIYNKRAKRKLLDVGQQLINLGEKKIDGNSNIESYQFNQQVSRDDLTRAIICHEYPFSIVDHSFFRRFLKNLRPEFKLITRNTAKSDCLKMYESEKDKLYKILEKLSSKVSFTSDMWTSQTVDGYMSLTCHFIDDDWKLNKKIINFLNVQAPHTGEEISKVIMARLYDWNLDGKVQSFVLDNATTNDVLIRELLKVLLHRKSLILDGDLFHVRCCAHVLNLVVQDGLGAIEGVVHNIRESIKYIKSSHARLEKFKRIARQVHSPKSTLSYDVKIRWNSTFLMLEKAINFQAAFSRMDELDERYMNAPSFLDWDNTKIVVDCLRVFYEVTNRIPATNYPTSNVYFNDICDIYLLLQSWYNHEKSFIAEMARPMLEKFEKYWAITNSVLAIACILDPRYKLKSVEYFFGLIYENMEAKHNIRIIRNSLKKLYEEYANIIEASASQGPSYMINNSVTCNNVSSSHAYRASTSNRIGLAQFIQESLITDPKKSELDIYLDEPVLCGFHNANFDILNWWKFNGSKYPIIARIARDILAIPVSTVASESAFSTAGRVLDDYRCSLNPRTVQALICTQDWLKVKAEDLSGTSKDAYSTIPLASQVDADYDVLEVLSFEDET